MRMCACRAALFLYLYSMWCAWGAGRWVCGAGVRPAGGARLSGRVWAAGPVGAAVMVASAALAGADPGADVGAAGACAARARGCPAHTGPHPMGTPRRVVFPRAVIFMRMVCMGTELGTDRGRWGLFWRFCLAAAWVRGCVVVWLRVRACGCGCVCLRCQPGSAIARAMVQRAMAGACAGLFARLAGGAGAGGRRRWPRGPQARGSGEN